MRFAKPGEVAENPYHRFVTPPIASWYELKGDGLSNEEMRNRLNEFCYNCCEHCGGSIPVRDKDFLNNLNKFRPVYCDEIGLCLPGAYVYPEFTQESIDASNPNNAVLKLIEGDGSFTGEESEYFLDFGQIPVGRHRLIAKLAVVNEVYEPADRLDVDFDTTATAPYLCTGCDNFTDLPWSGEGRWSFVVEIPTAGYGPGVVTSQIVLQPKGLVDTGEREPLEPITLTMSLEMVPSDNDGEIVPTDGGGGGSGDSPLGCSMSPNRNRAGFDATLMFISIIATVYIGMRRKNIHY